MADQRSMAVTMAAMLGSGTNLAPSRGGLKVHQTRSLKCKSLKPGADSFMATGIWKMVIVVQSA